MLLGVKDILLALLLAAILVCTISYCKIPDSLCEICSLQIFKNK